MESLLKQEAADLYNRLHQGKTLFSQIKDIEFSSQPKDIIYREKKLILYRFRPRIKTLFSTPLLIVFALINRPDILDLSPECSFIAELLQAGRDIYLIDWGYPDQEDKDTSLHDYIARYMKNCVHQIKYLSKQQKIDLLGICQGGVLSLCYASLFSEDVRHLVLISTPIDFQTKKDVLSRLAQKIDLPSVVKSIGNIPGAWLSLIFIHLKPFQWIGKKYLSLVDHLTDPIWLRRFMLMEKWLIDTPDQAGRAFLEFVKMFYQQNLLVNGKLMLAHRTVDLNSLTMPILNVIAGHDHIIPPQASRILVKYVQSKDYSVRVLSAGHIGLYVSQTTHKQLAKTITTWLKKRESTKRTSGDYHGQAAKGIGK